MNKTDKKLIFKLEDISKSYKDKTEEISIINKLNFEVEEGDFISILGKSGSGKSTLLNLMGLLDEPDSGKIYIDDLEISNQTSKKLDDIKNKNIGFIFQFHYLFPEFTALENVMLPSLIKNKKNKKEIELKAVKLLQEVNLTHRLHHKPNQLSGGEKQRVAIARALINSPKIILADEPTGNLDQETSQKIHDLFLRINKELNQTIIVVTHSKELARLCNKNYYLNKGVLSSQEVL